MAQALMAYVLMAHAVMARPRTRLDGRNPEPSLTAPALIARSTSTTFSNRLAFPHDPTSDEPTSSSSSSSPTRATSTSTIKREEKEKPRHGNSGQDGRQELDGGHEWDKG